MSQRVILARNLETKVWSVFGGFSGTIIICEPEQAHRMLRGMERTYPWLEFTLCKLLAIPQEVRHNVKQK